MPLVLYLLPILLTSLTLSCRSQLQLQEKGSVAAAAAAKGRVEHAPPLIAALLRFAANLLCHTSCSP